MGRRKTEPVVLIIDDEPAICDLFATALGMTGLFPVTAHNAEAGLRMIERGVIPDAILLDLRMPGMGGLGFLLRLRADARTANIPVAIVTGDIFVPSAVRYAAETLKAEVHFKPMEIEAILDLAGRLVDPPPTAEYEYFA